jgi:hypothetical protein
MLLPTLGAGVVSMVGLPSVKFEELPVLMIRAEKLANRYDRY